MVADAVDMWYAQDARQRRKLNRCPVCDSCGERIQDGYALEGNGRKGGWFYVDEKGKGHFTRGKRPSRAFWNAYAALKSKIIARLQSCLKEL